MSHAWFPLDCIVGVQQTAESGAEAEVSYIGREGFVGVPLFMGGRLATGAAVAVTGGTCLRVGAQVLRQQARRSMAMERSFLRYAQALFFQTAQLALCRHIHGALARTCSCLLFSADRLESAESLLTMPLLSRILRFEPAEVGAVLRQIQESAAIDCRGGTVKILKRPWLLGHACECYALTEKEYRHLVPQHRPAGISSESVRGRVHEGA
jgi:CRP-like cAMP-binding protein